MAANNYYFWPDLYETWYLRAFEVADNESDIKNSKFNMADPIR